MKIITPVSEWNGKQLHNGLHILIYTLGNGSMLDEPRKNGYVVHDEEGKKSKFFLNYDKARLYAIQ